jgi:hypothetical protein
VNETKKKTKKSGGYVKTFRLGAVAANIFHRRAPGGFEYLDFGLSRAWKTSGGKEGYSQNFFSGNSDALHAVIDQACHFIRQQDAGDEESLDALPPERPSLSDADDVSLDVASQK